MYYKYQIASKIFKGISWNVFQGHGGKKWSLHEYFSSPKKKKEIVRFEISSWKPKTSDKCCSSPIRRTTYKETSILEKKCGSKFSLQLQNTAKKTQKLIFVALRLPMHRTLAKPRFKNFIFEIWYLQNFIFEIWYLQNFIFEIWYLQNFILEIWALRCNKTERKLL